MKMRQSGRFGQFPVVSFESTSLHDAEQKELGLSTVDNTDRIESLVIIKWVVAQEYDWLMFQPEESRGGCGNRLPQIKG